MLFVHFRRRDGRRSKGQALVEFSLVLVPFLLLLLGIVDLGRGIYLYNGVSQAAREIARATAVHPCDAGWDPVHPTYQLPCTGVFGTSTQTAATAQTQRALVPGLGTAVISCVDVTDTPPTNSLGQPRDCKPGDFARVTISAPFGVVTPFIGAFAPTTFSATSHIEIP